MELTGRCVVALPIVSGTSKAGKAFQKRDFVVETAGQYPKKVCFQLFGEKVNECPNVGEEVTVSFDAESREWNGRWFTQLNAWKVERQAAQPGQASQPVQQGWQQMYQQPQPQVAAQPVPQGTDGLPF